MSAREVVFIHGAWVTNACWDPFVSRFREQGFATHAPAWPFMDAPVTTLRAQTDPRFARLGIRAIVDHQAAFLARFTKPPLLVGQSFGGLFVQLLMDRGLGAAGIVIDGAPPRGVLPGPNAVRAGLPVLVPGSWGRAMTMSYRSFRWGYAQTLEEEAARATYERHVVPAPGRIYWEALLGIGTAVAHAKRTEPLLLIAGLADRTVQPAMVRANYRRHQRAAAPVALREFPGRSHWLIAEPGWEEVADAAIGWAQETSGGR